MAGGSYNISALKRFNRELKSIERAFPNFVNDCVREAAERLYAKAIRRTPALPRELRRGWTIGKITMTASGVVISVYNTVPYASSIEYGYRGDKDQSRIASEFMMTLSNNELEKELPAIVRNKLNKFIKTKMKG